MSEIKYEETTSYSLEAVSNMNSSNTFTEEISLSIKDDPAPAPESAKKSKYVRRLSSHKHDKGRWTNQEHKKFIDALLKLGKNWKQI
jgi:hypothetical protein